MNCLGKNVNEIKNSVKSDISNIIKDMGGYLEKDNSISGVKNQAELINKVKNYISDNLGSSFSSAPWLTSKNGNIQYHFPYNVENYINEKLTFNRAQDELIKSNVKNVKIINEIYDSKNEEDNLLSKSSEGDLLFAPTVSCYDNEDVTEIIRNTVPIDTSVPADFDQWVQQRESLLSQIKKDYENFKKNEPKGTKYYRESVALYQKTILKIDNELKNVKSTEANSVFDSVAKEIDYLLDIVNSMDKQVVDIIALERRLDILSKQFLNEGLNGVLLDQPTKNSNVFYVQKGNFSEIRDLTDKVLTLKQKYNEKTFDVVASIFEDMELIQEYKRQGKLEFTDPNTGQTYTGEDALQMMLNYLKEVQGINVAAKWFSGAAWGDIVGQMARITFETALKDSQSEIEQQRKIIIENIQDLIRTGFKEEDFEQKDEFGVPNGYLIHKFSSAWFKHLSNMRVKATIFNKLKSSQKEAAYKFLMNAKKENEEILDFTKIKSIKDKFSDNVIYNKSFSSSEEDMSSYEKRLRSLLGNLLFEELVEDQIKMLEDYSTYYENNYDEFSTEIDRHNPVKFLNHFMSANYEQTVDGNFLSADYTISFPIEKKTNKQREIKDSGFYSKDFKKIEENPYAFKIWQSMRNLYVNTINPQLREDGFYVSQQGLDLAKVDDYMHSTLWKNINLWEKSIYRLRHLWSTYKSMFINSMYSKTENANKPKMRYGDTIKSKATKMAKVLERKTLEELMKRASSTEILSINTNKERKVDKNFKPKYILDEDGIELIRGELAELDRKIKKSTTDPTFLIREKQNYINSKKRSLSKSIANAYFYKFANINLVSATVALAETAGTSKASKKALGITNFLQNYVKGLYDNASDVDRKDRLDNLYNFIDSWKRTNLLGNVNHKDLKLVRKALSTKLGSKENKSDLDKKLIKFLENDVKDIDNTDDFSFHIGEKTYKKEGDKYLEIIGEETNYIDRKKDFEPAYAEYLGSEIANLGTDLTLGSAAEGWVRTKVIAALALNVPAGILNRIQGSNISRILAASGKHGFNEKQLQNSRNFLSFCNMDRYITEGVGQWGLVKVITNGKGIKRGVRNAGIIDNVVTFKMLANSLGLIQKKINEIDGISGAFSSEGFNVMDWAVNFAEFHNQGEVILSVLQNYYLEYVDNNGNTVKVPIFDGETQEFVYKPGTLTLKDKYRTPENIRIWEDFKTVKGAPNPHLTALFQSQAAVERGQGNYSEKDKAMILGSTIGRIAMTFKKYRPEQIGNEWGKIQHDAIMGGGVYEGRYRKLLKYAPSAALLLGAMGLVSTGSVIIAALPISGVLARQFYKKVIKKEQQEIEKDALSQIQQIKLALSLITETATRYTDRYLSSITRGSYKKLADINNVSKSLDNKLNIGISEKERKLLSESTQDLANQLHVLTTTMCLYALIRVIGEVIMGANGDDDDDDDDTPKEKRDKEELYKERMKFVEQITNLIINRYGYLKGDALRDISPEVFLNDAKPTIVSTILSWEKMISKGSQYLNDEDDFVPFLIQAQRTLPIPIANSVTDAFLKPGTSPIQNPRIWEEPYWLNTVSTEQQVADRVVKHQREKVREAMVDAYTEKFKKEVGSWDEEKIQDFGSNTFARSGKISKLANDAAIKQMNKLYRKKKWESSVDYQNRINFKEEIKKWEEGKIAPTISIEVAEFGGKNEKSSRGERQSREDRQGRMGR